MIASTTGKRVKERIGEVRPSQLLYTYGIGSVVDLQHLSVMVLGLDDWDLARTDVLSEDRLLAAVRAELGNQIQTMRTPPLPPPGETSNGFAEQTIGVPVAVFPRWLLCPLCRLLAPISSGLFQLKVNPYNPEESRYVHGTCPHGRRGGPTAIPARFLVACPIGHVDDFPWVEFVHDGGMCSGHSRLRLDEYGPTGEAADVQVTCTGCDTTKRMSDAFSESKLSVACSGRAPHLRRHDDEPCVEKARPILLGASNIWFPRIISVLSIPHSGDRLEMLLANHLHRFEMATSLDIFTAVRHALGPLLADLAEFTDAEVWETVQRLRAGTSEVPENRNVKRPEWQALSEPASVAPSKDFLLSPVPVPDLFTDHIASVVLVERLRAVKAFLGFTRLQSLNDFGDRDSIEDEQRLVPLSRRAPTWLPAADSRGEGIFIQFREDKLAAWERRTDETQREREFQEARRSWLTNLGHDLGVGGETDPTLMRRTLLHTFSHTLMRQLAIECGYALASLTERIYALPAIDPDGPMAGVLIYTAATDSEGTLGGLIRLGAPEMLGRLLTEALEAARLCASDPLCAEHAPDEGGNELHGAACHACLFAPETSCEMGNRWLDRTLLVETFQRSNIEFFSLA